jgi:hypothetical protein
VGDIVSELYELPIGPDVPSGSYELAVGMYDLATGERLSQPDTHGETLDGLLRLGSVQVKP